MHRAAGRHLRSVQYYGATRNASTSVVQSSSGGILSSLFGGKGSKLPPLDVPLAGVTLPPPLPDFVEPRPTEVTTLENGLKIASQASLGPIASIGLYIKSGSIYETDVSSGASHLLEKMAFKSTVNRSHLRLIREVEAIGGNVSASAYRDAMAYTFDAAKTHLAEMVEVLIDSVQNPIFFDWEVKEQLHKMMEDIDEHSKNPQGLIFDGLHSAGYTGALAQPLMASESALNRLNSSILQKFVQETYTPPRIVLAASGVEHKDLLSIAEPLLKKQKWAYYDNEDPTAESLNREIKEPASSYVGGEFRQLANSEMTHIALAFEVPRGWHDETTAIAATVLQMLLGGGSSYSSGGPGKGMHSRLYLNVLNGNQFDSFSAFTSIYKGTGLFGIYAAVKPDLASKAVKLAAEELLAVAKPGKVVQEQLDRAKEATKSKVLINLESRITASEDIGQQLLTYGDRKPVAQYLKAVDSITLQDITSVAKKITSTPLTMASWGNVSAVPSYSALCKEFGLKSA